MKQKNNKSIEKRENSKVTPKFIDNSLKINKPYDKSHKDFFSVKKNFLDFAVKYLKQDWMKMLTEENLEQIDKEFIRENFETYESDVIYKIILPQRMLEAEKVREIYVFLIQEMQSNNDYTMPFRLLTYMFCIWMREFKNMKNPNTKEFSLPAIIPCVFYNGQEKWKAKRQFADIVENVHLLGGLGLNFKYILVDTKSLNKEEILEGNTLADNLVYLDSLGTKEDCIEWMETMAKRLLDMPDMEKHELQKWIRLIIRQRFGIEIANVIVENMQKGDVKNMSTGLEQVFDMEYEKGLENGKEELVRNMILENMKISLIVKVSQMPESKVKDIKDQMIKEGKIDSSLQN